MFPIFVCFILSLFSDYTKVRNDRLYWQIGDLIVFFTRSNHFNDLLYKNFTLEDIIAK